MTTVMASFIAIVLFGMIMIATISYGDALGIMSAPDSVVMSQRLQSAAELVSQIQTSTGSRPRTAEELVTAGMPPATVAGYGEIEISCSGQTCTPMSLCLSLPWTTQNMTAAMAAASRIKGSVSGECGRLDVQPDDRVVVSILI